VRQEASAGAPQRSSVWGGPAPAAIARAEVHFRPLKKSVSCFLMSSTVSEKHSDESLPKSCTVALLDEARPRREADGQGELTLRGVVRALDPHRGPAGGATLQLDLRDAVR
jgi:hypothetical protein